MITELVHKKGERMINPVSRIVKSPILKKSSEGITKFVLEKEGVLLTGTSITCNAAGIALTYKNSPMIHDIIFETRKLLNEDIDKEERSKIIKASLKQLTPLVLPIMLFFIGSTTAEIVNHKRREAKIATLTAALSLAQTTISEYEVFKEEVRKEVGEEKYKEIKNETNNQVVSGTNAQPSIWKSWRDAGYEICYIPDFDYFFPSTEDKLELGWSNLDSVFQRNGQDCRGFGYEKHGVEIVTYGDVIQELTKHTTGVYFEPFRGQFQNVVGWEVGRLPYIRHWTGHFKHPNGMTGLTVEIESTPTYI